MYIYMYVYIYTYTCTYTYIYTYIYTHKYIYIIHTQEYSSLSEKYPQSSALLHIYICTYMYIYIYIYMYYSYIYTYILLTHTGICQSVGEIPTILSTIALTCALLRQCAKWPRFCHSSPHDGGYGEPPLRWGEPCRYSIVHVYLVWLNSWVCMHIHMDICIYMYIYIHIYIYIYVYIHIYT